MIGLLEPIFSKFIKNEIEKIKVWEKAIELPGIDPALFRADTRGNLIKFNDYGKQVPTGWEMDHIFPKSLGGSDEIANLQPLQWQANRKKGGKLCG